MATNKRTLSRIGFYCGLALFLIITLFPFFVMLMTSFRREEVISMILRCCRSSGRCSITSTFLTR
ncbi:hypothetical protein ACLB1O_10985 [Escherichia coli]